MDAGCSKNEDSLIMIVNESNLESQVSYVINVTPAIPAFRSKALVHHPKLRSSRRPYQKLRQLTVHDTKLI